MCKWEVSQPWPAHSPEDPGAQPRVCEGTPRKGCGAWVILWNCFRRCIGSGFGNLYLEYDRGECKAKTA